MHECEQNNLDSAANRLYRHMSARSLPISIRNAERIARDLLPYSLVNNWSYTLHDFRHSENVILVINRIIDMLEHDKRPSGIEMELLYVSAWYHDIGMTVLPRHRESDAGKTHADVSCVMIRHFAELSEKEDSYVLSSSFGGISYVNSICMIVESHCLNFSDEKIKDDERCFDELPSCIEIDGNEVRIKFLSALLCLADLLDKGTERSPVIAYGFLTDADLMSKIENEVNGLEYPLLNEDARKHWNNNKNEPYELNIEKKKIFLGNNASEDFERDRRWIAKYLSELGLSDRIDIV